MQAIASDTLKTVFKTKGSEPFRIHTIKEVGSQEGRKKQRKREREKGTKKAREELSSRKPILGKGKNLGRKEKKG